MLGNLGLEHSGAKYKLFGWIDINADGTIGMVHLALISMGMWIYRLLVLQEHFRSDG